MCQTFPFKIWKIQTTGGMHNYSLLTEMHGTWIKGILYLKQCVINNIH